MYQTRSSDGEASANTWRADSTDSRDWMGPGHRDRVSFFEWGVETRFCEWLRCLKFLGTRCREFLDELDLYRWEVFSRTARFGALRLDFA